MHKKLCDILQFHSQNTIKYLFYIYLYIFIFYLTPHPERINKRPSVCVCGIEFDD